MQKRLKSKAFDALSRTPQKHGETSLRLLRISRFQVQLLMGAPLILLNVFNSFVSSIPLQF
jgi:hypothetical protein